MVTISIAAPTQESTSSPTLSDYDGSQCAACTIAVGLVEQIALVHKIKLEQLLNEICSAISSEPLKLTCEGLVAIFGRKIVHDFDSGFSPDHTCSVTLAYCKSYATCSLFRTWPPPQPAAIANAYRSLRSPSRVAGRAGVPVDAWICVVWLATRECTSAAI